MINIVAKDRVQASDYANGQPFKYISSSKDLFNNTSNPTHVLEGWTKMKSTCISSRLKLMLKGMEISSRIEVIRHDK